jgi:SAM-dependent methyltransferase
MRARIITAATRLGVFEALACGPLEYHTLAAAVGAQDDGLSLMLDALVGFGYLHQRGQRYANSRMARKYLVSRSPHFVGTMVLFQDDADQMTQSLATVIRSGEPDTNYDSYLDGDSERWRRYVVGMRETARLSTQEVIAKVSVPATARRLLDLGGSHGLHACSFCARYPQLQAVVFDRPAAVAIGQEFASSLPFRERVQFLGGDLWNDSFGENYDIVLLFAVLHLFSPEQNRQLLMRVAAATRPGGQLVIADFLSDRLSAAWVASFSLGMRSFFGQGRVYDQPTIISWLSEAGFACTHVRHLRNPASLLIATKTSW